MYPKRLPPRLLFQARIFYIKCQNAFSLICITPVLTLCGALSESEPRGEKVERAVVRINAEQMQCPGGLKLLRLR